MENTQSLQYIKQAFELKNQKYYKPAIEMLYKALELENDNIEILYQIGELYFLMNNYTRALQYLEKVQSINPTHIDSLKLTRTIKERQNELDKVLDISEKLFNDNPNSENLKELVKILVKLKLFEELDKYKDSEYFNIDVQIECANAFYNNGETEKAKNILTNCSSEDERVLLLKGKIKFDEKDLDAAEKYFQKLVKTLKILKF